MTLYNISQYIFTICLLFQMLDCSAQDSFKTGIMPTINLNTKFINEYTLYLKLESRNHFEKGLEHNLTEISFLIGRKVGQKNRVAVGYSYLYQEEIDAYRFIQKFSVRKRYEKFGMVYQISTDQTMIDKKIALRVRGKITTEIPFDGVSIDSCDYYFKAYNEYVFKFFEGKHQLEFRWSPMVGYKVSEANKIEIGVDHRINTLFEEDRKHKLWVKLNWYIKL